MTVSKITCPSCKSVLKATSPIPAGKKIQCPKCAKPITASTTSRAAAVVTTRYESGRARSKSRLPLFLGIGLVAVLIFGGIGLGAWFAMQPRPQSTATVTPPKKEDAGGTAQPPVPRDPLPINEAPKTQSPEKPANSAFFRDGNTNWKIYVSPQAEPTELFAAEELRDALKKISGAFFEVVVSDKPPSRHAIIVGDLSHPAVQAQAATLKLKPDSLEHIAVYKLGDRLYLAGNQPRAALYAVYHFLQQQLGVRWLWPGPDGEFMPSKKQWDLPELNSNHQPGFVYRGFHLCGDWRDVANFREWMARNFINIHRHADRTPPAERRRGFYSMLSDHNAALPGALFEQHPEYFAEIKGTRYKNNICFSNPDVQKIVVAKMSEEVRKRPFLDILSIFPSDNEDYCRCALCGKADVSTVWFEFYNRVTDELKKEFPKLKFATIAYQGYRAVPQCRIRNSEFVEYASYSRCNLHSYGHPDCRPNQEALAAMESWRNTGQSIGNYSYEYDIYSQNRRFTPFLSVIEDAVKKSKELGHVAVIPEVLLHPKTGPDATAAAIQNRLSIYLYARLLWNPNQSMQELLDDWCKTAFGAASAPMRDYYTALDKAWSAMPLHTTILSNALRTAPHFMTEALRKEATAAFAAAETRLPAIADAVARDRATAALQRERVLLNQWQDLYRLNTDTARLSLPLLMQDADFARVASKAQEFGDKPEAATRVRLAWTSDSLLVKWKCNDPKIQERKTLASVRDDKVIDDDSVELELSSGATGETWHLATNAKGIQQDWRDSSVGIREDKWNPTWQVKTQTGADSWDVEMAIPFASLGAAPNPNESWQVRFLRHNAGRADIVKAVFPERETALLQFSSASRTDRSLLWWSGMPEREGQQNPAITQEFTDIGWQIHLVAGEAKLRGLKDPCDAYWFRHPHGVNKVPADFWDKHLVPVVKNGAVAVFYSYLELPLDQYFRDPALKVKLVSCGPIPLAGRTTVSITPGEWSSKPNNLQGILKSVITPAYGYAPVLPEGWTVLATANGSNGPYPYLLARRYGKGLIVVGGADIPVSRAKLLENFVRYHESAP